MNYYYQHTKLKKVFNLSFFIIFKIKISSLTKIQYFFQQRTGKKHKNEGVHAKKIRVEGNSPALVGRRRCANITRNVAAVAPSVRERSSLAYGPVVPEEHNSSQSITPRAIISSFQKPSPKVFHLHLLAYPSPTFKSALPPTPRESTSHPGECTRHACLSLRGDTRSRKWMRRMQVWPPGTRLWSNETGDFWNRFDSFSNHHLWMIRKK